jgi:hypothetical protein
MFLPFHVFSTFSRELCFCLVQSAAKQITPLEPETLNKPSNADDSPEHATTVSIVHVNGFFWGVKHAARHRPQ